MTEVTLPAETIRRTPQTWLIIASVLNAIGIFVGAGLAMMSAMMFDAPGSDHNHALILIALSFVALPISCLAAIVCAWIAYAMKYFRVAVLFSLLPVIPVISAVIGVLWLQFASGGNFGK